MIHNTEVKADLASLVTAVRHTPQLILTIWHLQESQICTLNYPVKIRHLYIRLKVYLVLAGYISWGSVIERLHAYIFLFFCQKLIGLSAYIRHSRFICTDAAVSILHEKSDPSQLISHCGFIFLKLSKFELLCWFQRVCQSLYLPLQCLNILDHSIISLLSGIKWILQFLCSAKNLIHLRFRLTPISESEPRGQFCRLFSVWDNLCRERRYISLKLRQLHLHPGQCFFLLRKFCSKLIPSADPFAFSLDLSVSIGNLLIIVSNILLNLFRQTIYILRIVKFPSSLLNNTVSDLCDTGKLYLCIRSTGICPVAGFVSILLRTI